MEDTQPKVSVGVVGVLLILAGFWAYNNFSKTTKDSTEQVTVQTSRQDMGSISGGAIGPKGDTSADGAVAGVSTVQEADNKEITKPASDSTWRARQIERNSIKDSTYKVQKGDTLWQIAQGKYGSGFEWTKILQANKDKVGFLPNGSQALIEVGQELVLP